uniref:Uncharacterized protein n=1 Tax=Anguilla anguilla TaxID=7936 RepID=A0A0E9WGZ6_ANGAN
MSHCSLHLSFSFLKGLEATSGKKKRNICMYKFTVVTERHEQKLGSPL